MFNDLLEITREFLKKLISSRLFILGGFLFFLFCVLGVRLFNLQIVNGEEYQETYMARTERTVSLTGTRGNIYDRSGNVLAYNELSYNVVIHDNGDYETASERNRMLLLLVRILNRHGESVEGEFQVGFDSSGEMVFTSASETSRKRFLADLYGLRTIDELDDPEGKYPSDITAKELFASRLSYYGLDELTDENGEAISMTDEEALAVINIRYTMGLTAYRKYESTTIASNVSKETMTDVLENSADLLGVGIEESTIRVYNDSQYFSAIIGYIGKIWEDELETLRQSNPDYELTDLVGKTGIEASMETYLQGKKGYQTMYVDNMGRILEIVDRQEPEAGKDLYLTLDRELQIGVYHILEQQLAGIITSKLVNRDLEDSDYSKASNIPIPVKDAYYQLINNNVLDMEAFSAPEASQVEKSIYAKYSQARERIIEAIHSELLNEDAAPLETLPEDMFAYMQYIYSFLVSEGIIMTGQISQDADYYQAWRDDTISLRDYLYAGIADSWIDTTKLSIESRYSGADDVYSRIVEYVMADLETDQSFAKRIYRYLINDGTITGRELCLALYSQNILAYDEGEVRMLEQNGEEYAFQFIRQKISDIEITPAQLALDPCSASCVITDVNTGEVLCLVTYPSYDNNKFSGTVDADYYNKLNNDLSLPLFNNATQAQKAPGSTFKPIMAVAALEEGVIGLTDTVDCTGRYTEITPNIRCWIYPGRHDELNVEQALQNSCNVFFAEMAHRLSTDENGNYSPERGIEMIRKYASMFGLDETTGIEIAENSPQMTTENPESSAIGQSTNAYSNVQLSRYISAVANKGTVFKLSLLDKMTDSQGNLIEDFTPAVRSQIDIQDSTWNAVHTGMRRVISDGSASKIFNDLEVPIAGKTGTAEEVKNGHTINHAFFVSFAPYDDPEIAVTVNIPYGYSSSNAATAAKSIYRFYYGYTDLDYILNNSALSVSNVEIGD
ncbi:MAG TPA: penicillin-binding protein [Candidatus Copromonas avistercoris]|nr:penicillin-binding protein [Candidatus Copromonas avistercoris]